MITRIKRLFAAPVFADVDKTGKARMLNMILLASTGLIFILFLVDVISAPEAAFNSDNLFQLIVFLTFSALIFLLRRGFVQATSYILIGFTWIALAYQAWNVDGVRDTAFTLFIIPILVAALLLNLRAAAGLTGLTIIWGWVLVAAENAGFIQSVVDPPIQVVQDYTVLFLIAAVLVYLIIHNLETAVMQSRRSNEELETLKVSLENRVANRTRDLATSAEVSRSLSTILDLDQLIRGVVTQIQAAFDYYHVHIYLQSDDKDGDLVMAGGTGEAGRTMLSRGHKLIRGQGLVGKAAVTNQPVLVPDVSQNPNWLPNVLLPDTKAEAAIPITLGEQVLGVLDVQHNVVGGLDSDSVALLQSIASQVAIALQNARQYQQAQASEARTQLILESINTPVMISKVSDGSFFYFNDPALEVVGLTRDQLTGRPSLNFYEDPAEREKFVALLREQQYVDNYELKLKRVSGESFWGLLSARIVNFQGEPAIITSMLDVSAQREAQEAAARHAAEMETVANVSTAATTILEPERLLSEAVNLIKSRFDLYHAHIHLLNDRKDTLELTAGAGEIGRKMVAEGRRIPLVAKGSLVAAVARTRVGAIRNYDPPGEGFMPHLLLAETRCEMAVPIVLGGNVLGVLDVRSDEFDYFNDAHMQTYTTLASQIAVALQNARSFARSEQALKELSELSRRLTHDGWEKYLDQETLNLNFAYDLHQVIKGERENGRIEPTGSALVQPIQVLGETIGQISVKEPQVFVDDAAEIMDAVANRLSAHIENLRLTAQTEIALAETAEQARRRAVLNQTGEQLNRAETLEDIFNIIADSTAKILPSDRVTLAVLADDGRHFSVMSLAGTEGKVPMRVDQNLAGSFIEKAIKTGNILVTHDQEPNPETGIRSSMVVPLITGSGAMGTLNVGSKKTNVYGETDQGLILQIASLLSSVIENKRLLIETQERARELTLINRVVAEVSGSLDIKQSLQVIATELAKAVDVDATGIALLNPDKTSLTVMAEYYDPQKAGSSLGYVIPIEGNALTQEVLSTRQTVVVEDAQNHPLTKPVHVGMRRRGVNTLYVIPMFAGNEIVGTVGIDILEKGRLLQPQQLRLAETLVYQAATAVQNARLFTEAQQRTAELSLINAASELASSQLELPSLFESVGKLLQETFAAESLYFALYDHKAELITFPYFFAREEGHLHVTPRLCSQGGYTGQIITARESLLRVFKPEGANEQAQTEGAQVVGSHDTDCYLGTPMIVGNEVIGVIALNSYQAVRTYNEQDQHLLETLADTIGVAIQNIRQFQAAQHRAEREALINSISQKIQSASTVQSALQTAVSELGQALKLKRAVVELTPAKPGNGHSHE